MAWLVGRIKALTLVGQKEHAVVASLEIDSKDLPLYKGLTCTLVSTDFLGGKAIRLNMPENAGSLLVQDDTIPTKTEKGLTDEIAAKVTPMLANLDTVSGELKTLLKSFRNTSAVLEKTLGSFKGTSDAASGLIAANQLNISTITGHTATLTGQLVKTEKELDAMVGKFNRFGDSLNKVQLAHTVDNLNKTVAGLNGVLADVNAGRGSLGKLTKNDSLYTNLNKSSEALDALLKDMKSRPGRYIHFSVFGKKDKE